ncbi:MAG TPA: glutamine-synthetase adenylyltransferase, partial [Stellaceae bacterium]|nr:glutamine-synthetase adenylyltransferase [Stellaceae bacterium]
MPLPADPRRMALGFAAWQAALDRAGPEADGARAWSADPAGRRLLAAIFGNSPFLSDLAVKEWAFLSRLVAEGPDPLFAELVETVERRDDLGEDTAALMRRLRLLKRRTALLAALADLAGLWSLEEQMAALSRFAEAALGAALRHLLRGAAERGRLALADPADPERDSGVFILGMGKLGGRELNYSSDIDLILLYDAARVRVGARDGVQSFFARLARDLVRLLEERT